jgi:hypothetical protein
MKSLILTVSSIALLSLSISSVHADEYGGQGLRDAARLGCITPHGVWDGR